jgi:Tol biopolymer transport system component
MKKKHFAKLKLQKVRRITAGLTDHEHPAVSPDGRFIAYYYGTYGSISIVVADMNGRLALRISPHGGNNTQPAWHPSGERVAFRHQHKMSSKWEIWATSLFGDTLARPVLADPRYDYKHPSFDQTGTRMAYFSDEGSPGIFHLWLFELEERKRTQLTFGEEQNHCHPVFSPDGQRLVFHAYEGIDQQDPPVTNLYELELASGEITPLTSGRDQYKHPFYLEDGVITCHHEDNTNGDRWLEALRLKNGDIIKLTSGKKNDKHPYPYRDHKGRLCLAWSSKKLGEELDGEPKTYDIFTARLLD